MNNPLLIRAIIIYAVLEGLIFLYLATRHLKMFMDNLPIIMGLSMIPAILIVVFFGILRR